MSKLLKLMSLTIIIVLGISNMEAYARSGDSGFEGGISSGEVVGKTTYDYKEVIFLTGEPVVFTGTLTIKKTVKQDSTTGKQIITANYTYKLTNDERSGTLTKFLSYSTVLTKKDNGQTIEETSLNPKYTEVIKVDDATYTLKNYDFTKTNITDSKPAVDYLAGNLWGRKTYEIGTDEGSVTVDITGDFYGYNQYWGTTETQVLEYMIQSEGKSGDTVDKWGGTASVSLSNTSAKQIKYVENEPETISFEGGFVQTQYNNSVLKYSASLPEFDAQGVSTDRLIETSDSLKIESFPVKTRLMVPNINKLKGHWAENDIKALYSLEVFSEDPGNFNPQEVMTRAEFADAIVLAAKEVPIDSTLVTSKTSKTSKSKQQILSPFVDVAADSKYFENINNAYKRGIISGRGNDMFAPDDYLTMADAITIIIRALGLEALAPAGGVTTSFIDDGDIPAYARNHIYVAQRIGLVLGDEKGYLKPREYLTKARAAVVINKLINYMRDDLKKDYRERIINY
ncbi:S-layer homology domain-containing protein [Acetivibrio cellulolyticus]|uniref:S-layer homology domain-containing protein n=1 Tax=Acetivibrio cellulolyticus TaxID=35830 RepID=UPI0001E2EB48|nr:S-layer homology domain-containing protein [Acetivibrio cellulolyticus]